MHKIGSFPKVWELGHKSVVDTNAMTGAVFVQEKIDGTFSILPLTMRILFS